MSRRADHAAEMRYAIEHKCSLKDARDGLARLRWLAQQNALEARQVSGPTPPPQAVDQSKFWWNRD